MKFSKLAFILTIAAIIYVSLYISTSGSFKIKWSEQLPYVFEYLWLGVPSGIYDIPEHVVRQEALKIDGHVYVYYGFFPAIIRGICLELLGRSWFGKLGGLSCVLALFVISSFSFLIVKESLRFWSFKWKIVKTILVSLVSFSIVVGSPVLVCMLRPFLYEELILWGYAFSSIGIYGFILFWNDKESKLGIALLSMAASLALITRSTFGVPLYLLVAVVFFILVYLKNISGTKIALLCLSLLGLSFQLWYNYVRFGNILTFVPTNGDDIYFAHVARHGGIANYHRIKDLFLYYFVPIKPSEAFSFDFPFFHSVGYTFPDEDYFWPHHCRVYPILVVLPSTFIFYVGTIYVYLRELLKKNFMLVLNFLAFCIPFILETLLLLSYNACFERFKPEFMPLVLVCMFISLRYIKGRNFITAVVSLCIMSVAFNICWALQYKTHMD